MPYKDISGLEKQVQALLSSSPYRSYAGGLATGIRDVGAVLAGKKLNKQREENERVRSSETEMLLNVLRNGAQPPLQRGRMPQFQHPDVQGLALSSVLKKAQEGPVKGVSVGRNSRLVNPTTGEVMTPTGEPEIDYNDPFLPGGAPNTAFQDYQRSLREAGRSQTNINMPTPTNKATETFGTGIGERANKRLEQALQANEQNLSLERMEQALDQGIATGVGQETMVNLKNLGQSLFGLELGEQTSEQEVMLAIGNRLAAQVRNPESGMGLPGNTSNRDLQFLKGAVPGIQKTPEGNRILIDFLKKVNQFKSDVAREQQRIIDENNGTVPNDLDSRLMEYINGYDLLSDEEMQRATDMISSQPETQPTRRIRFDAEGNVIE